MFPGFTLAEVLITLGVIGVVAAMTMPSLIGNYQKKQYVNQLRATYSIISQFVGNVKGQEGVTSLGETSFFTNIPAGEDGVMDYKSDDYKTYLEENLPKYLKILDSHVCTGEDDPDCELIMLNGQPYTGSQFPTNEPVFYLSNGASVLFHLRNSGKLETFSDGSTHNLWGWCRVDVNGKKKPNTFGRDIFEFHIYDNRVSLYGSRLRHLIENWAGDSARASCNPNDQNSQGRGCAARIEEEGWEMKY